MLAESRKEKALRNYGNRDNLDNDDADDNHYNNHNDSSNCTVVNINGTVIFIRVNITLKWSCDYSVVSLVCNTNSNAYALQTLYKNIILNSQ